MASLIFNKYNGYTGWLGNRMFQYASTIGISLDNNMDYCFAPHEYLDYFDGKFNIDEKVHERNTLQCDERFFQYDDAINLYAEADTNLTGYYQSYKYFDNCSDLIKKLFTFKKNIQNKCNGIIKQIRNENINTDLVAIHFRLGDYMSLKDHHTCLMETDYYKNAIDFIVSKKKKVKFLVFSNDQKLALEYMHKFDVKYFSIYTIDDPTPHVTDMCLMSMCDHIIMANSTMSWWASYLNKNDKKIIIAPIQWFAEKRKDWITTDLFLPQWIQL